MRVGILLVASLTPNSRPYVTTSTALNNLRCSSEITMPAKFCLQFKLRDASNLRNTQMFGTQVMHDCGVGVMSGHRDGADGCM